MELRVPYPDESFNAYEAYRRKMGLPPRPTWGDNSKKLIQESAAAGLQSAAMPEPNQPPQGPPEPEPLLPDVNRPGAPPLEPPKPKAVLPGLPPEQPPPMPGEFTGGPVSGADRGGEFDVIGYLRDKQRRAGNPNTAARRIAATAMGGDQFDRMEERIRAQARQDDMRREQAARVVAAWQRGGGSRPAPAVFEQAGIDPAAAAAEMDQAKAGRLERLASTKGERAISRGLDTDEQRALSGRSEELSRKAKKFRDQARELVESQKQSAW